MHKITILIPFISILAFLHCQNRLISSSSSLGSITGVICAKENGISLAGVSVRLVGTSLAVQTDTTGRFLLSDLPADETILSFMKEHYDPQMKTFWLGDGQALVMQDTIYLSRSNGTLAGVVLDLDSKEPVSQAYVFITDPGDSLNNDSTITDSTGYFIMNYIPPDSSGYLTSIKKAGFQTLLFNQSISAGDSLFLTKYLQAYLSVSGIVYDSDSTTPLENAIVSVDSQTVQSDSSGRFIVANLLPVDTGHLFTVSKKYYETLVFRDTISSDDTVIGSIYIKKLTSVLKGTVRLQGQIDHSGTVVQIGSSSFTDTTDALGQVLISGVPAGNRNITASRQKFASLSDTIEIPGTDTTNIEFDLSIQSGTIHTRVDWNSAFSPYSIYDTLEVAAGGSLYVDQGVEINMAAGSRLCASGSGIVNTMGTNNALVEILPAALTDTNIEIEIPFSGNDTSMSYTMVRNITTILKGGTRIKHCLFVHVNDPGTDYSVYVLNKEGDDSTSIDQCDFIRINSARGGIAIQDSTNAAGLVVSNCIFYLSASSSGGNNYLTSQNYSNGITTRITVCNFYADCSLTNSLLSLVNADTSKIYELEPGYVDIGSLDFHLKKDSPMLLEHLVYLGALGEGYPHYE